MGSAPEMKNIAVIATDELDHPSKYNLGREGFALLQVVQQGGSLIPTLLIGTKAFREFRASDRLPDVVVNHVLEFASAVSARELTIRPATSRDLPGMPSVTIVPVDTGRVRYAIERIYRRWSDDRPVAFRTARSIHDNECLPAVIVQATTKLEVRSVVSRNSNDGQKTGADNFGGNVNNTVLAFEPTYSAMLGAAERATGKPTKVYFETGIVPRIVQLENQLLTPRAALAVLHSMHNAGYLNDIEVLQQLRPDVFVRATSPKFVGRRPACKGLPASPGLGWGRIVQKGLSPQELRNSPFVYVTLDFWPNDPEDMDRLASCTSAVGTSGGDTCHLAVTARGMGKPAVVGATSLRLDYGGRRVILGTQALEEGSLVAMDGSTGEIWFGLDIPSLDEGLVPRMEALASIDWVEQIVAVVSAKEGFNALTLSERIDLANLRQTIERLRAQYG